MKGDRKLAHMGVKSFQNFLRGCQNDLPRINENDEPEVNEMDYEIANLYEKMAKYAVRYALSKLLSYDQFDIMPFGDMIIQINNMNTHFRPQKTRSSIMTSMTFHDFLDYLVSIN